MRYVYKLAALDGGKPLADICGKLCAQVDKVLGNKGINYVEKGVDNVNNYL